MSKHIGIIMGSDSDLEVMQEAAKVLDEFLRVIREHKQKHDAKRLPAKSKSPLAYLTDAKRKVKK